MDYSNIPNTLKKNQSLVTTAFVMGLLSLICAFTCLSFLTPVFGGLGILFALLSKGKETHMEKKAKTGMIFSAVSLSLTLVFAIASMIFTFITFSQYEPDELHDYLNEAYEETYGQSFDEIYEQLYGEDFGEALDELYGNY